MPMPSRLMRSTLLSSSLAVLLCSPPASAAIQTNSQAEREMMRSAQLWQSQYRTDLARQQVNKLLLIEPNSAWAWATLASIALQENKKAEAEQILQKLQAQKADPQAIAQLQALLQLYSPQSQQALAQMRLLSQSGRTQEAAALARQLFPDGPLALSNFTLEYYRTLAAEPGVRPQLDAALLQAYERTQNVQYQYLWLQRQLAAGSPSPQLLRQLEQLAVAAPAGDNTAKELWRWALHKLPWDAVPAAAQAFLQRYPKDEAIQAYLQESQQRKAQAQSEAQLPIHVAKRKANQALDQGQLETAQAQAQQVLAIDPQDAEGWGLLGYAAARQGQYQAAQAAFEKAHRFGAEPHWKRLALNAQINALLEQADSAIAQQDATTMARLAQQILALDSQHVQGMTLRAQALHFAGQVAQAQQAYQQVLARTPVHLPALQQLVAMLVADAQLEAALSALERYAPTDPAAAQSANALRAQVLQAQAQALLAQGLRAPALRQLEAALALTPADPWLRHQLARQYLAMPAADLAQQTMDEGVQLSPDASEMRYARALIRAAQDQWPQVVEDLRHVPAAERSSAMQQLLQTAQLHTLLAQALAAQHSPAAVHALEQAWALSTQAPDAQTQVALASIWQQAGLQDHALRLWQHIRQRDPQLSAPQQLAYAQALSASPQPQPELAPLLHDVAQQAAQLSTQQQYELLDLCEQQAEKTITALLAQGHTAQARAHAQAAFLPEVGAGHTLAARGRLLAAAEDWAGAVPLLQQAVEMQPQDFMWTLEAANAYARTGDQERAYALASRAADTAAEQAPWQQLALVRLWQRIAQPQKAEDLLTQLLQHPQADIHEVRLHQGRLALSQRQYEQASEAFGSVLHSPGPQPATPSQQASAQQEYQAVQARRQAWVEVGAQRLNKSGSAGISALRGWEIPMVAWRPSAQLDGHHFVHVDRIQLDAGTVPIGDAAAQDYGQMGAALAAGMPTTAFQGPSHTQSRGFNVGVGFQGERSNWDVGLSGLGLPVTNVVGGMRFDLAPASSATWRLTLGRRPITGSVLSYAGAKDPATGKVWGGVVHTFAALRVSQQQGRWDSAAELSLGSLTGKNVAHNTRTRLRLSAGTEVWRGQQQQVYAGAAVQYLAHQKNLAEYSWGHGGYYSPTSSVTLSVPLEWTGRTPAWNWRLQASVSASQTARSSADLYPRGTAFPDAIAAVQQRDYYRTEGGFGTGWAVRAAVERQLNTHLVMGAQLGIDRSENYAPNQFQIYWRYAFSPVRRPLGNQPQPLTPYSEF